MTTRTEAIPGRRRSYLPAAGHDWFLPLYDPFVKLLGGDYARRVLLDQATIRPSHHVLDVGCGTGTFVVLVKRLHPNVEVVGLDPDPKAHERGEHPIERCVGIRQPIREPLIEPDRHRLPFGLARRSVLVS